MKLTLQVAGEDCLHSMPLWQLGRVKGSQDEETQGRWWLRSAALEPKVTHP